MWLTSHNCLVRFRKKKNMRLVYTVDRNCQSGSVCDPTFSPTFTAHHLRLEAYYLGQLSHLLLSLHVLGESILKRRSQQDHNKRCFFLRFENNALHPDCTHPLCFQDRINTVLKTKWVSLCRPHHQLIINTIAKDDVQSHYIDPKITLDTASPYVSKS